MLNLLVFLYQLTLSPQALVEAVAGVLAGYLILLPRAEVRVLLILGPVLTVGRIGALLLLGVGFLLQLWQGVASLGAPAQEGGVAYFAHIGGFLVGAAMMVALRAARGQPLGNPAGGLWIGPVFHNWLVLIAALVALLALTALLAATGYAALALLLQALIVLVAALIALADGGRRVLGRSSFLGSGTRVGRLLALVQVLAALGILSALLAAVAG